MAKILEIDIHKAQPHAGEEVYSVHIHIDNQLENRKNLKENGYQFVIDATCLETVLHNSLPGGTYDQLLKAMLQRRASHFVVPFGNSNG